MKATCSRTNIQKNVTHIFIIDFVEGVNPPVSEAQCGCTSFHKYVFMIKPLLEMNPSHLFISNNFKQENVKKTKEPDLTRPPNFEPYS